MFFETIWSYFGVYKPLKIDLKSGLSSIFKRSVFRTCFWIDFGVIFGSPEPEKHWFYQGKTMIFAKLAFSNKLGKSTDFQNILGSPNHWKSIKISMQTCYWNAVWIFIKIWWFSPHLDFQNAPPKSLKYWLWELLPLIRHPFGAPRSNLDGFWLAWARFFIAFGSISAAFQIDWT